MFQHFDIRSPVLTLVMLLTAAALPPVANAGGGDAATYKSPYSTLRLMNGGEVDGAWNAGIQITMPPGWKTYWRVPGEGGVPPVFDWTGSENVDSVAVSMPMPHRFVDENGEGIGYKKEAIFPVEVKLQDPDRPARLSAQVFYAVCNDICVPVNARVELPLTPATTSAADNFLLLTARNAVPSTAASSGMQVRSVRWVGKPGATALEVKLAGVEDPSKVDIFVESGGVAYFRKPELVSSHDDQTEWRLTADMVQPGQQVSGLSLRLTISDGESGLVHETLVQ
jgi:DsbC/DsbD-like thiol-disulfide interchange protein